MSAPERATDAQQGAVETVRVFVIDPDGVSAEMGISRDDDGGCGAALRSVLGCRWFDVVRLSPGRLDMWVDDEGLTVADPVVNVVATRVAKCYGLVWQPYAGRVVFASHDDEGDTTSLSRGQLDALASWAVDWGGSVVSASTHPAASERGVIA